ncbi:MAG: cytochrome c biogenesis protein CcsA [Halopseudomonas sp.]
MTVEFEQLILWAALIIYVLAGSLAIVSTLFRHRLDDFFQGILWLGLVTHTLAIGLRWIRLEHGPFLTMFEILSSNIWSVTLFFALTYWRIPTIRPVAAFFVPLQFMMMGWLLLATPGESIFPPTYDTIWLYIHVSFGKVFMGALVVASSLSAIILSRNLKRPAQTFATLPNNESLTELSYRFMALGLIFQSLMLVAGAIWAQDAWGRYWDWDPLESWSFISWLLMALALHTRITWKLPYNLSAAMVLVVFVIAFLTFFGVPFISMAPHKGAV